MLRSCAGLHDVGHQLAQKAVVLLVDQIVFLDDRERHVYIEACNRIQ